MKAPLIALLFATATSQATLIDRGNGLIYDTARPGPHLAPKRQPCRLSHELE